MERAGVGLELEAVVRGIVGDREGRAPALHVYDQVMAGLGRNPLAVGLDDEACVVGAEPVGSGAHAHYRILGGRRAVR